MRAITLPKDIPAGILAMSALKADTEYLFVDQNSVDFKGGRSALDLWAQDHERALAIEEVEERQKQIAILENDKWIAEAHYAIGHHISRDAAPLLNFWKAPADLNGKKLLFLDDMGLGDFLMLAPLLRKIKRLWPGVKIGTVVRKDKVSLLSGIPHIDHILSFPIMLQEAQEWDYHVSYERLFEDNPRAKEIHGCALFAEIVNLHLSLPEMVVDFNPGNPEMPEWFNPTFPRGKGVQERWVGIFLKGSKPQCEWPTDYLLQLTHALAMVGYYVFWLGARHNSFGVYSMPQDPHGGNNMGDWLRGPMKFLDLCGRFEDLKQLAAFARDYLDIIVSPDSFGVHLGGVLNIPTIGLFGPFSPELLSKHYLSVKALRGRVDCSPCFKHGFSMPCNDSEGKPRRWCLSLDSIPPEAVFQHVIAMCPRQTEAGKTKIQKAAPADVASLAAGRGRNNLRILRG
jgi:ADP-heptose:LPS heptosyltransferase